MVSFGPETYGESFADVYDQWYGQITDAEATADFVTRRAEPGSILELGVGTGRLALPLVERGHDVIGLDASTSMLAKCPPSVMRVLGDMSVLPFGETTMKLGGALCAFNTLFNLPTLSQQAQFFEQTAACLAQRAPLIVETFTGRHMKNAENSSLGVSRIDIDKLVLSATKIDPDEQTITGQHVDITEAGITMRPWRVRWTTPQQLDDLADRAGLTLFERYSSWHQAPFEQHSDVAISVYLKK